MNAAIRGRIPAAAAAKHAKIAHYYQRYLCQQGIIQICYNHNAAAAAAVNFSTHTADPMQKRYRSRTMDIIKNLEKASRWVKHKQWNPSFTKSAYEAYIEALSSSDYSTDVVGSDASIGSLDGIDSSSSGKGVDEIVGGAKSEEYDAISRLLLTPEVATYAAYTLTRMKIPTEELSWRIRSLEKLLGEASSHQIDEDGNRNEKQSSGIPFTYQLSLALIRANGKAGNVARTLDLLRLRGEHNFKPTRKEYEFAIQSIISNGVKLRTSLDRVYKREGDLAAEATVDNPTKWLDAILINMHERGFVLKDISLVNQMINAYAAIGRTGRANHFFYRMKKEDISDKELSENEMEPSNDKDYRIRMEWDNKRKIPDYKVPSLASNDTSASRKRFLNESSKDWSLPLVSAFQFAESLTHGACGHPPITLDLTSWNTLMKVCTYRGALWRANHVLRVEIPRNGLQPDTISYNTMLHGLARVGDAAMLKDLLTEMTNIGIPMDKYTVQALVDGLLNASDITSAITIVQDLFNQHSILPPYTSHLKILEFALSNALPYEARRHVDFIKQLWKWSANEKYDSYEFRVAVEQRQKNRHLSKEALQKMFSYYGYTLKDEDFN